MIAAAVNKAQAKAQAEAQAEAQVEALGGGGGGGGGGGASAAPVSAIDEADAAFVRGLYAETHALKVATPAAEAVLRQGLNALRGHHVGMPSDKAAVVFHWTTAAAAAAILQSGCVPQAQIRNGRVFGTGMYFGIKPQDFAQYSDPALSRYGDTLVVCVLMPGRRARVHMGLRAARHHGIAGLVQKLRETGVHTFVGRKSFDSPVEICAPAGRVVPLLSVPGLHAYKLENRSASARGLPATHIARRLCLSLVDPLGDCCVPVDVGNDWMKNALPHAHKTTVFSSVFLNPLRGALGQDRFLTCPMSPSAFAGAKVAHCVDQGLVTNVSADGTRYCMAIVNFFPPATTKVQRRNMDKYPCVALYAPIPMDDQSPDMYLRMNVNVAVAKFLQHTKKPLAAFGPFAQHAAIAEDAKFVTRHKRNHTARGPAAMAAVLHVHPPTAARPREQTLVAAWGPPVPLPQALPPPSKAAGPALSDIAEMSAAQLRAVAAASRLAADAVQATLRGQLKVTAAARRRLTAAKRDAAATMAGCARQLDERVVAHARIAATARLRMARTHKCTLHSAQMVFRIEQEAAELRTTITRQDLAAQRARTDQYDALLAAKKVEKKKKKKAPDSSAPKKKKKRV